MSSFVKRSTPGLRARIVAGDAPRWLRNLKRRPYVEAAILSVPPWADREALLRIWERCRAVSAMSGVDHHVAHIVPLNHPRVCGLTVPWNLEILPARVNLAASNRLVPEEQMELCFTG